MSSQDGLFVPLPLLLQLCALCSISRLLEAWQLEQLVLGIPVLKHCSIFQDDFAALTEEVQVVDCSLVHPPLLVLVLGLIELQIGLQAQQTDQ